MISLGESLFPNFLETGRIEIILGKRERHGCLSTETSKSSSKLNQKQEGKQ